MSFIYNALHNYAWIDPVKRRLRLRSLPEVLPNSAAMVTAEICAIPRSAYKPLTTSCIWGEAKPLSDLWIKASRRFFLTRSPTLAGTSFGAITSISTISYGEDRGRPDNSHLSPDKYKVLDDLFQAGQAMVSGTF